MAKKIQVILTDDLDGSSAVETVYFSLDGTNYSIDLSSENAAELRGALAKYIAAGARVKNEPARKAGRKVTGGASAMDIRSWAQSQGMKVSARGRVSAEIRAAYEAAHA